MISVPWLPEDESKLLIHLLGYRDTGGWTLLTSSYSDAQETGIPFFFPGISCAVLVFGRREYWETIASLAIVLSPNPLREIKGLRKAGVSENGGFRDLAKVLEEVGAPARVTSGAKRMSYSANEADRPVLCGKVLPVLWVKSEVGGTALSNLERHLSVRAGLKLAGLLPSAEDRRASRKRDELGHPTRNHPRTLGATLGIPQARAEVIKAAVADGTHHFRDQLMLLRDPQFLVNARNASSSGTGPEGKPGGTTALAERLAGYLGLSNRWPELLNGFTDKEFARLAKTARSHPLRGYYRTLYQYLVLGADVHWLDSLNHAQEELSLVDRKCRKKASRARVEFLKEGLECTLRQFKARLLVWEEYPLRLLVRSGSPLDPLVPPLVTLLEKMGRRSSSLSESGSGSSPEWPRIGSLNMHTLVCVLKVVALLSTEEAAQEALAAVDAFTSERYSTVAAYLREGPKGPKAESPKGLINSIKTVVALSASSCEPTDEVLRGLRDALERADLLRLSGAISARLAMALPAILKKGQDPDSTP